MSKIVVFFIALTLLLVPAHTTHAATFDVCTLGDLTTAITTANTNTQADVINFNCSTTLTFTSQFTILNDGAGNGITINANGNTVVFDGGNSTRFFGVNPAATLTLNGFTLQNGNSTGFGGAIRNTGTLTVNNNTFTSNSATFDGGAIYNTGTLTVNNNTFTSNSATFGGAIRNDSTGTLTVSNSTFTSNSASIDGGAIYNSGTQTVSNSIFTDNSANNLGGAIYNQYGMTSSQNSHYENNTCVSVSDNGGNTRFDPTTSSGCPGSAPIPLDVSALTCNGDNAEFTINNGDANFDITGTGAGLDLFNSPAGLVTLTGPATWTNIRVTERRGERQFVPLGGISCPEAVIIPPPEPVAPPVTVLGCALDTADGLEIANAPDDTYCRLLMKNGAVVSYSGAIPADLIGLGVILAVDVYRLEGGMSINTFPNYARVCLAGAGRLFYMDSRNAPRVSIELATETEGSLTCGWIPAPGTLILTN